MGPYVFGTWHLGGAWGEVDDRRAIDLLRSAWDAGVNTFDTARAYGNGRAEQLVGRAFAAELAQDRASVVVSTKGGLRMTPSGGVRDSSAASLLEDLHASLRALNTDYVDVYHLHHPDPSTPLAETADAVADFHAQGLVRHAAVSNYSVEDLEQIRSVVPVTVVQYPYHLFRRDIEESILPYARDAHICVMAYSPLAHGILAGESISSEELSRADWRAESPIFRGAAYSTTMAAVSRLRAVAHEVGASLAQVALAWALRDEVSSVIVGPHTREEVVEGVAATRLSLPGWAVDQLEAIAGSVPSVVHTPRFA